MATAKLPKPTSGQLWPPVPIIHEPNPEDQLWRYLDFTKFVSMLDKSAIFMPSAELFTDKWEGSYPYRDSIIANTPEPLTDPDQALRSIKSMKQRLEFKKRCYISCWHINTHESAAMWDLYTKGGFGLAIKTTFQSLKAAIGPTDNIDSNLWLCYPKVIYMNYDKETFEGRVGEVDITPFFHKRKSFEHEKEFRIIINSREPIGTGFDLHVNIELLIEYLYISPYSPTWFKDLVVSVLKKYSLGNVDVFQSDIERNPIY